MSIEDGYQAEVVNDAPGYIPKERFPIYGLRRFIHYQAGHDPRVPGRMTMSRQVIESPIEASNSTPDN